MSEIRTYPAAAVLTVEEAAHLLRIGRSAAYAAVRTGEIPSVRVGRTLRIPRYGLERMLGPLNGDGAAANGAVEASAIARDGGDHGYSG